MSSTCDVNRVQKVHLNEICSVQIPGKSILIIIFQFLFFPISLVRSYGQYVPLVLANSGVLIYRAYGSDAWC